MCYRRNPSLRNKLAKTRCIQEMATPTNEPTLNPHCTNKCLNRKCPTCPNILTRHLFLSTTLGTTHTTKCNYTCRSHRIVYLVTCKRCHKQYVGQTLGSLHTRLQKMKADVKCNTSRESTYYFRNNQHTTWDIQIEPIDHTDIQTDKGNVERDLQTKDQHTIHHDTPRSQHISTDTIIRTKWRNQQNPNTKETHNTTQNNPHPIPPAQTPPPKINPTQRPVRHQQYLPHQIHLTDNWSTYQPQTLIATHSQGSTQNIQI